MFHSFMVKSTFAVAFVAVMAICSGASASSDSDQVLEKIAALEARVATLETKNREYRREAEDARAQAKVAADRLFRTSNATMPTKAVPASKNHVIEPLTPSWTGAFWGASAGGAATRSSVMSSERPSISIGNPPPNNIVGEDILGSSGPGRNAGSLIDVFAGWNTQISNVVVGGQLEATSSNLNFDSAGLKTYTYFDANGPTGQTAVGDFRPQVASRWMASALLRAGVLLNEQTLVYGIGGWTIAQFETRNVTDNPFYQPVETFLANGWTAGAGIERKLDSNWSVRAEYRYTNFGPVRTNDHFNYQIAGPPVEAETNQRQTTYSQSMRSGRIGFAYSFNTLR